MDKLLLNFIEATARINQVLEDLVQMGQAKQKLIILGRVQELDKLIQKEGILVSNLEKLEGARFKLQGELASGWGMPLEELTANTILDRLQTDRHQSYDHFKSEIEKLTQNLGRLRDLNSGNDELINQSLDYIDMMQSLLYGDIAGTYSEKGLQTQEKLPHPNLLDKKA